MSKSKFKQLKTIEKQRMVSEEDLESMIKVFSVQSESRHEKDMVEFVEDVLYDLMVKDGSVFYDKDKHGNIFITKGIVGKDEYYPCIAAHLDTVHTIKDNYSVMSEVKGGKTIISAHTTIDLKNIEVEPFAELMANIKVGSNLDYLVDKYGNDADVWEFIWYLEDSGHIDIDWATSIVTKIYKADRKQVGGVGDDQGGIWIALDLLTKIDVIKIALFSNEEVGCIGSNACDIDWFKDCGFVIQGDRKNSGDIIHSGLCSDKFLEFMEDSKFGYRSAIGLFTDVTTLVDRDVNISCANISVGYYNPHMDTEYTVAEELSNARDYLLDLIGRYDKSQFEYKPMTTGYRYGSYNRYYDDDYYPYAKNNNWDELNGYGYWHDKEDDLCDYHISDYGEYMVDAHCDKCNPEIKPMDGIYVCEYCGEELEERKYSRNCPHCMSVKIKLYVK